MEFVIPIIVWILCLAWRGMVGLDKSEGVRHLLCRGTTLAFLN